MTRRLAGAPISWGICEVPGWGHQVAPARVLAEMREAGLEATELGPPGYLPAEPAALARTLAGSGLRLAAGFVAAVLHRPDRLAGTLAELDRAAAAIAGAGGDVLVVAAATNADGYDRRESLGAAGWAALAAGVARADEAAARRGLTLAFHPHWGTLVQGPGDVDRLLALTGTGLCLDTGHLLVGGADPPSVAERAGRRVRHVHLKDVDAALAARVRGGEVPYAAAVADGLYRPLGDGDVDVGGLVGRLDRAGYAGWYVLEQDVVLRAEPPARMGPIVDVRRSVAFIDGLGRDGSPPRRATGTRPTIDSQGEK
jgi:inosose dehydratase